jgi:hypothetical protein
VVSETANQMKQQCMIFFLNIQDATKKRIKLTGIFFDLSKAHEILNHNILLSKLEACGIKT